MFLSVALIALVLAVTFIVVNKLWCFWSRSKASLVGKTAIVTGGASGIGYQTALTLAGKGCRVIVADIVNISQAVEELIKETHNRNIIGKTMDLQSFKSVRDFVEDIVVTEERLDILICNAGIGQYGDGKYTEDDLQMTMQVNYFSHFLLTHLLLDLLKKSAPSRIIFTSSIFAYVSSLTLDTLNPKQKNWSIISRIRGGSYSDSKLALAAAAKMFGKKLKGTGVTANAVHPGGVKSPIYKTAIKKEYHWFTILLTIFVFSFGKNCEQGAQTLIHLAQSDEVKGITGQSFYEGMRVSRPFQLSDDFCQKIWDKSIEYTKLKPHEVKC